jgi:hypothetical protein
MCTGGFCFGQGQRTYSKQKDSPDKRHLLLSQIFYFFCTTSFSMQPDVYKYTSGCIEIVYELQLLSSNTASETFLHKSGALRSANWIVIIVAPAWR